MNMSDQAPPAYLTGKLDQLSSACAAGDVDHVLAVIDSIAQDGYGTVARTVSAYAATYLGLATAVLEGGDGQAVEAAVRQLEELVPGVTREMLRAASAAAS